MGSFVNNLKSFTLHPHNVDVPQDSPYKTKVTDTLKGAALYMGLAILACIPVFTLMKLVQYFYGIDLLKLRAANMKMAFNGPKKILIIALIAPLMEETMCRLWLSFKRAHVVISVLLVAIVIAIKVNGGNIYSTSFHQFHVLYLLEGMALAGILLTLINKTAVKEFAQKHFNAVYYGSCIGFGLLHIMNFAPFKWSIIWAYPLLTLPQIILGFILGHIRIKNGFVWGVALHCIINLGLSLV